MSWNLDCTLVEFVADDAGISKKIADKVVNLFETGKEIAYVSRYRTDAHEGMTCEKIRHVYETLQAGKQLNDKVTKAIKTVETKASSQEVAAYAIDQLRKARDSSDVTEVTKSFATARKTKAEHARNLGLEETAERIHSGQVVDLYRVVDKKKPELASIENVEEQLKHLLADKINNSPESFEFCKKLGRLEGNIVISMRSSSSKKAKAEDVRHFERYNDFFVKHAKNIQNYQVLALMRGEEKEALTWNIVVEEAAIVNRHPAKKHRVAPCHQNLYEQAFSYAVSNSFIPKVKRSVKKFLSKRAEVGAIECFSRNLEQLFRQEGLRDFYVLALDPGYKACKAALLKPSGHVISSNQLHFGGGKFSADARMRLTEMVNQAKGRVVVAIGNGSASVDTQKAVQQMIEEKLFQKDIKFCVVPENGASKYSITDLAEKELPGMPVTEKSAVSIGRRLIDPVSEYVKIEPKHLGVGMYQHSVNEKRLSEALQLVVRDAVSLRGVDINTASVQLLQQVCGLNKKTAAGVVALRKKLGRITARSQLTDVKGLGPVGFQQCAGFLMVTPSSEKDEAPPAKKKKTCDYNPLDGTTVHPESYDLALKILNSTGLSVDELKTDQGQKKLQILTTTSEERLIVDLLTAKNTLTPPPPLMSEVRKITSLIVGEEVAGRVANNADFGTFIDIGVERNALAHKSSLQHPLEVGAQVMVMIKSIDVQKGHIGVIPL